MIITPEVINFIKDYAKKEVDVITEDTTMPFELGIDSLTFVRMVNDAEKIFDVALEDEALIKVRTVGDFAKLLVKQ